MPPPSPGSLSTTPWCAPAGSVLQLLDLFFMQQASLRIVSGRCCVQRALAIVRGLSSPFTAQSSWLLSCPVAALTTDEPRGMSSGLLLCNTPSKLSARACCREAVCVVRCAEALAAGEDLGAGGDARHAEGERAVRPSRPARPGALACSFGISWCCLSMSQCLLGGSTMKAASTAPARRTR